MADPDLDDFGGFEKFDEGRYDFVCSLGSGVYGDVNLYYSSTTGFRAVKFLPVEDFCELKPYFDREKRILSMIRHPSIVRLYGHGAPRSGDRFDPYFELGFVPGGTLSDFLTSHINLTYSNCLDPTETAIILYGVAFALSLLHARGWVHRDVKSENIFLDARGRPVVGDFGFSRPIEQAMTKGVYTLNYAAPEQLLSTNMNTPIDVWAFGMLIYEVRTGLPPYWVPSGTVPTADEVSEWISTGANTPELDDRALGDLFRRCTKRDPTKRPTMHECVSWIKDAVESGRLAGVDRATFAGYVDEMDAGCVSDEPLTVDHLIKLAPGGSGACNYVLGEVYYRGIGVPPDVATAGQHFRAAAEKRHAVALERVRQLAGSGAIEATPQEVIAWQDEFTLLTRNRAHLNVSQSARLSCLASSNLSQWRNFRAAD